MASAFYIITYSCLLSSWVLSLLSAYVLSLSASKSHLLFPSAVFTIFVIDKSIHIKHFINSEKYRKPGWRIIGGFFDIENLLSLYYQKSLYLSNHFSVSLRAIALIFISEYFLFWRQELLLIENTNIRMLLELTAIWNYAQAGSVNCLFYSSVNDFLNTTSTYQIPMMQIQSASLLILSSVIALAGGINHSINLSLTTILIAIRVLFACLSIAHRRYLSLDVYNHYQSFSLKDVLAAELSICCIPHNTMPFNSYMISKGQGDYCFRDKLHISDPFILFNRQLQQLQALLLSVVVFSIKEEVLISTSKTMIFFLLLCAGLHHVLGILNVIDIIYRRITNNYLYYVREVIQPEQLQIVLHNSPHLRYLEIKGLEGIDYYGNTPILDIKQVTQNFNSKLSAELQEDIFKTMLRSRKENYDFKVLIGSLVKFLKPSAAFFSPSLIQLLTKYIETSPSMPQDRYFICTHYLSLRQQLNIFQAIFNRLLQFGVQKDLFILSKTHTQRRLIDDIIYEFQSQMLQIIMKNKLICPYIPVHPQQLIYDLIEEL